MPFPYNSAVPPLAQSMMQRGAGLGMPNPNAAVQQQLAGAHPAVQQHVQNLAAQMRAHAAQEQARGVPPQQAMQNTVQRFAPQAQGAMGAGVAGGMMPPAAPQAGAALAMAPGMQSRMANPLNAMFGPPPMMPPAGPAPQMGQRVAPVPAMPVAAPNPVAPGRNPF